MPKAGAGAHAIIVLGMHRSGTSCLAGSLESAGLHLGAVNTQAPHNFRGNRESLRIMSLHETLLADNHGAWDAPPESLTWQAQHRDERDAIISAYPSHQSLDQPWGFKDPRTLLTLDGWLDALPQARLVASFRHPLAVAASLQKRNDFDTQKTLTLWKVYNRRLLGYCERLRVPLLCFDWPPERYQTRIQEVAVELGLSSNAGLFFEKKLRNQNQFEDQPLPDDVASVYQRLQTLAG